MSDGGGFMRFLAQTKVAALKEQCNRCATEAGACRVTVIDIKAAIELTEPACAETAEWFCRFVRRPLYYLESAGCDRIKQAGGIPVIFNQLRRWPAEANVVKTACVALHNLARFGSDAVKLAMRSVPDCEALLRAAQASGLDKKHGHFNASRALAQLGLS